MQRNGGFSVIELLLISSILTFLSLITVPNLTRTYGLNQYRAEVETVFHTIRDARSYALASRACNGVQSTDWTFVISAASFQVTCNDGTVITDEPIPLEINVSTIEFNDGPGATAEIQFLPETSQVRIEDGSGNQKQTLKVVLDHAGSNEQQTICVNRAAGFPTIGVGDLTCS